MPMSKRKTIYKPKKGKRVSQKKLYKLPKHHGGEMKGGGLWADVKGIFTGGQDPETGSPMDVEGVDSEQTDDSAMDVVGVDSEKTDDSAMDIDSTQNDNSAMDVDSEKTDDSAMDIDSTQNDNSAMDVDSEKTDDSAMDVDSNENASGLAESVSQVGSLIGDSAKSVLNEGIETVTKPSDETVDQSDDGDNSEPFDNGETNDTATLKQEIETLKQENHDLQQKLIAHLEKENESLKDGSMNPEPSSNSSFGEPSPNSSFGEPSPNSSFGEPSPNSSFGEPGSLNVSGDDLPQGEENNSFEGSQETNTDSLSTIDLNSTPETSATDNKIPGFGSDISPIKLDTSESESQQPTGGTKHKKKKQRRTRRKKH